MNSVTDKVSYSPKPRTQKQKDAEKKMVTGGGAIAATASVANVKATKSGIDMFTTTGKISRGMNTVTNATRTATNVAKKSKGLMAKVAENAKWAKNAILNWGKTLRNSKILKPLVNSKLFRGTAGFLGYGFGAVTLISGLSDIGKVTSEAVEKFKDQ